jgi:hypothetical protein
VTQDTEFKPKYHQNKKKKKEKKRDFFESLSFHSEKAHCLSGAKKEMTHRNV